MQHNADIPLAIVGLACRLPGADNIDEYWDLLVNGKSQLGVLPSERFNNELHLTDRKDDPTRSYTNLGGIVPELPLDPKKCPLPQEEIDSAHKIHLNLCEVAYDACVNSGYDPQNMKRKVAGVYIGHTPPGQMIGKLINAYQAEHSTQLLTECEQLEAVVPGQSDAVAQEVVGNIRSQFADGHEAFQKCSNAYQVAGMISRAFNLDGPAMAFDAACASGMRALAAAARSLQLGEIEMALVGSASYSNSDTLTLFSQAQSVSTTGTRPYDEEADGLVASEGYVMFVIKTLEQAIEDGDDIKSVIRGVGVSSDGKGKSLWAPRKEGQIEAVRRAYGEGLSPAELQYLEMHATSTQVGDATEMEAITDIFADQLPEGYKIPVGSVKANVGHTLETAGLASIAKTVLAMNAGLIPPQININQLNTSIPWDNIPFYVPQQAYQWPDRAPDKPRLAAVNAFGIGGLNVHVVLEGYQPEYSKGLVASKPKVESSSDEDAIAIVGRGAILPGLRTIEALWDELNSGKDRFTEVPSDRWDKSIGISEQENEWTIPTSVGAYISDFEYDWKRHKVPPKQVASADPLQFMLLDATDQALKDLGYPEKPLDKMRTGAIVGTVFGGAFTNELQNGLNLTRTRGLIGDVLRKRGVPEENIEAVGEEFQKKILKRYPALIDETGSFTASTLSSRLTKTFDLMGGAVAVDGGECSTFAALATSIDILRSRDCDVMICASGQRSLDFTSYQTLKVNGLLSSGKELNGPFDEESDGIVPGEAVGVVILKRLADAKRDGDQIRGVIRGIGCSRDKDLSQALQKSMGRAFDSAGITPDNVALVETASGGVPNQSKSEIDALTKVYGTDTRQAPLHLGSASAIYGHSRGGSGMASMLKAMSELSETTMPNTPYMKKCASYVTDQQAVMSPVVEETAISSLNKDGNVYAGINSFAESEVTYHVLLEGPTKIPYVEQPVQQTKQIATQETQAPISTGPVSYGDYSIARVSATDWRELQDRIFNLENVDWRATSFNPGEPFRLTIVAKDDTEFLKKLSFLKKSATNHSLRNLMAEKGIFLHLVTEKPRVAFCYPGQGSQYNGMLKQVVQHSPAGANALVEVNTALAANELPSFEQLAWEENCPLDTISQVQLSVICANYIMRQVVQEMGVEPNRVCGHSLGEIAALEAVGSWSINEAIQVTKARVAAINALGGPVGVLYSTTAPVDELRNLKAQVTGNVHISHMNAPDQTVIGGEGGAAQQLAQLVEAAGYKAIKLEVPGAFHTPLLGNAQEPFFSTVDQVTIEPPAVPLLSSVTNKYVADPVDIRENLKQQMVSPLDYVGLVERFVTEKINLLVEVGPRHVLTGLNKRILGKRDLPYVSSNHGKRDELEQLAFLRACLEAHACLDWHDELLSGPTEDIAETPESTPVEKTVPSSLFDAALEVPVVRVQGSAYELGFQHGQQLKTEIRQILRRYTELAGSQWDAKYDVSHYVAQAHCLLTPEALEELNGIAAGAEVSVESLLAHNIRLYLDAGQGGLSTAVTANTNPRSGMLHAANEEVRNALPLNDCLQRVVQVRIPQSSPAYLTFVMPGQVGCLTGINATGLAVSTSCLLDANSAGNVAGYLQTLLIQEILSKATDIDSALTVLQQYPARGAWTVCLSHAPTDRVCYIEFDGANYQIRPELTGVIAANHSQLQQVGDQNLQNADVAASFHRVNRLQQLFGGDVPSVTVEELGTALRDQHDPESQSTTGHPTLNTVSRADNQISVVMQPGAGKVWVTPGPNANGHKNNFSLIDLTREIPEWSGSSANGTTEPKAEACETNSTPSVATTENVKPADVQVTIQQLQNACEQAVAQAPNQVCHRQVVRLLEREHVPTEFPQFHGPAIVHGDNADALALKAYLEANGVGVMLIPSRLPLAEAMAAVDAQWNAAPAPHLFLMTGRDAEAQTTLEQEKWDDRREVGVLTAYKVCQQWFANAFKAKMLDQCTLAAVTSMGGDFGISNQLSNVEGGAISGLLKAVHMESHMQHQAVEFNACVVDADDSFAAETLVQNVCSELAARHGNVEVAYKQGKRFYVRPYSEFIGQSQNIELSAGANIVVTGGARGVTAVVAREMGKRFPGVKLHLIGSSPLPEIADSYHSMGDEEMKEVKAAVIKEALANGEKPMDAWGRFEKALEIDKTLREFNAEGTQAIYHGCDVSNRAAIGQILENIRTQHGPIQGVIHGAGFEKATRFDKKQEELVRRTVGAKVDGAANLLALTESDPLKFFVAFGSVSGRFGGVGQTDYSVANDMVAKLMDWSRSNRPELPTAVFHWHAWDDVGMAVRPESQHIRKLHNITFMPSLEGAKHLLDEIANGLPEAEVVITEVNSFRAQMDADAQEPVPANNAITTVAAEPEIVEQPLPPMADRIVSHTPGQEVVVECELDPTQDVFLTQHLFKQRPMFPFVVAMETMAETAQLLVGSELQVVGLRDLKIINSIRFLTDDPQTMRIKATQQANGIFVQLCVDLYNSRGVLLKENRPCFECMVDVSVDRGDVSLPPAPAADEVFDCTFPSLEDATIYHGPIFRSIKKIGAGSELGLAYFETPDMNDVAGRRARAGWILPSSLLDGCFFGSGVYLWVLRGGVISIPNGIQKINLYRTPTVGEACTATIEFKSQDEQHGVFDIVLYDSQNRVVLEILGYENTIVPGANLAVNVDTTLSE